MPMDRSDDLPQPEFVQVPAPKKQPEGVKYTPGDTHDPYHGHGGDYVINEQGHRVPVK